METAVATMHHFVRESAGLLYLLAGWFVELAKDERAFIACKIKKLRERPL
ncbi:MAG: hypothetical protein IJI37_02200 [Opitutales bacterium]|nr:hypothetical protein [Opitutales bacterium]